MTTADTATTTAAAPPTSARMTGRQVAALVVLPASQFMMAADFSVLNVALPEVGTSLGVLDGEPAVDHHGVRAVRRRVHPGLRTGR
ncbi:hypothetical protein [Streptomyces sp. SAI-149]|uniref:hypothetical protein n=1 Tax=Streptomyces sp. SAI-149 TaxID=2940542 RepID=UPI002473A5EE|nr:hypothetical protein [Streptomyces sp. SAI-149]MDH6496416.1 hypothetical protein [Streptomyces sp. SAI-149]